MKVAACLLVRDEGDSVLQWLVFHHLAGVDAFIVVDHKSSDDTVRQASRAKVLTDLRIAPLRQEGAGTQESVYLAVCRATKGEFDWIAFLDVDEYLVSRDGTSVRALCEANARSAAIAVPWLMFGASGHESKPSGLLIEDYVNRAPVDFKPNHHVKMLVRPAAVQACLNAHCFVVDGSTVLPDGGEVLWESPGKLQAIPAYSAWHVFHYFTRSKAHWTERLARGQVSGLVRTMAEFGAYDRNEVRDRTAARRGEAVRELLARMPAEPPAAS